jgi:hypothetical protein
MTTKRLMEVVVTVMLLVTAALPLTSVFAADLCVHPAGAGGCYTTIQSAVDAANGGDRIRIRAGTYIEQVMIIGKDLTLDGQGKAVVQAPPDMEQTLLSDFGLDSRSIIGVVGAEVTLRDLIIDGTSSLSGSASLMQVA